MSQPRQLGVQDLGTAAPTEQHDLSASDPDRVRMLRAMLDQHDREQAPPQWPSLLEGPIFIDHPLGVPQERGQEYIWWDN